METVEYLTNLISIILQQPKIGTILDEDGLDPEIAYGRIGIRNHDAFVRLHGLLDNLEGVETTPIRKIDRGLGYDFTTTTPTTIHFFYWK